VLTFSPARDVLQFGVAFDGPFEICRTATAVRFIVLATLDGITAAEMLNLFDLKGLRIGSQVHASCSTRPATHVAHGAVCIVNNSTLRCAFTIPYLAFNGQSAGLLHVGLFDEAFAGVETRANPASGWQWGLRRMRRSSITLTPLA